MRIHKITLIFLVLLFYIVQLLGGLIFYLLERTEEEDGRAKVLHLKKDFLSNHSYVNDKELEKLLRSLLDAVKQNIPVLDDDNTSLTTQKSFNQWDYGSSLFFALTVSTTIGYGKLAPFTRLGRTVCVLYGLLTIPFTLLVLSALAHRFRSIQGHILKANWVRQHSRKKYVRLLLILILFSTGLTIFFLLPSMMFSILEEWTFGDSFYYSFITLSTIGFGDFVPGANFHLFWYHLLIFQWILFGLAWMGGLIGTLRALFERTILKIECRIWQKSTPIWQIYDSWLPQKKGTCLKNETEQQQFSYENGSCVSVAHILFGENDLSKLCNDMSRSYNLSENSFTSTAEIIRQGSHS